MMLTENQTTDKSLSALIKNSAAYNAWANKQLIGFLQTKPAELMDKEVFSSFPSIRLTLIHIWECQKFWLFTIKGDAFIKEEFIGVQQFVNQFTNKFYIINIVVCCIIATSTGIPGSGT